MHVNSALIILNANSTAYHISTSFHKRRGSYFQHLQLLGHSWERRGEDMVIHQALTSGSGIWQSTEDKPWSSSTASQPHRRWAGLAGWSPVIASSSSSSRPSCSASFSPIYRPQRSWVINGQWDADVFLSLTFCLLLRVSVLPFSVQTRGWRRLLQAARNLLRNHRGSGQAVRAHQLINRAGVVYSRLILPGIGS